MNELISLGARIRQIRQSKNMTIEELAFKLNYKNRSSISRIEQGLVDVGLGQLRAIAEALEVSPSELMGLEEVHPEIAELNQILDIATRIAKLDATQRKAIIALIDTMEKAK